MGLFRGKIVWVKLGLVFTGVKPNKVEDKGHKTDDPASPDGLRGTGREQRWCNSGFQTPINVINPFNPRNEANSRLVSRFHKGINWGNLFLTMDFDGFYDVGGDVVDNDLVAFGGGVNAVGLIQLLIGGDTF